MIIPFIIISIIIFTLYGYAIIFKYLISSHKKSYTLTIYNLDILYGIFFVIIITIIAHFFYPMKVVVIPVVGIGLGFFLFNVKNNFELKKSQLIFFLLFLLIFINSSNSPTYDTQLYHHQIINFNYEYKLIMNLALLEARMGMISPWQLFLSLGNFKVFNFLVVTVFNFIPLYILLSEFLLSIEKKINYDNLFLIVSTLYILFFSLIHPFQNGIIMMHLGSLGTDFAAMVFFILAIYFFLKNNLEPKDNYLNYIIILSVLTVFARVSYLPIFILPLFLILKNKNFLSFKICSIFFASIIFWLIRSIANSGCLVFPAKISCLGIKSFISIDKVKEYGVVVKSFARTAPDHSKFMDLSYSINSFEWIFPWFKNYFLTNSIFQILLIVIILFFFPLIKNIINFSTLNKNLIILVFSLLVSLMVWLQAPDVRFALGIFISLPALIISFSIYNSNFKFLNYLKHTLPILVFFLVIKNYNNYKNVINTNTFTHEYDYSNFLVKGKINNFNVVTNIGSDGFCYDTKSLCLIGDRDINFTIKKNKLGYFQLFEIN